MKKLLAVLFVAALMSVGLFAQERKDVEIPTGSFIDTQYNGEWVLGVDLIELKDAATGKLIYSFPKEKRQDDKVEITGEGAVWSFYCKDTYRKYYFIKPFSLALQKNIMLEIDPDWSTVNYKVQLEFKE